MHGRSPDHTLTFVSSWLTLNYQATGLNLYRHVLLPVQDLMELTLLVLYSHEEPANTGVGTWLRNKQTARNLCFCERVYGNNWGFGP